MDSAFCNVRGGWHFDGILTFKFLHVAALAMHRTGSRIDNWSKKPFVRDCVVLVGGF